MKVVDVLGHHIHMEPTFQFGDRPMGLVRLSGQHLGAAQVVEVQHLGGVFPPSFGGGHLFNAVLLPEPIGIAEGLQAALGAHPSTGEDHQPLSFHDGVPPASGPVPGLR